MTEKERRSGIRGYHAKTLTNEVLVTLIGMISCTRGHIWAFIEKTLFFRFTHKRNPISELHLASIRNGLRAMPRLRYIKR